MTDRKVMGVSTPPGRVIGGCRKIAPLIRAMRRRFDDAMPEKIRALEAFRPRWQAVSVTAAQSLAGPS